MSDDHQRADGRRVVVAGAVVRGGRLLAARRTRPPALAGGWELPGGKVEPGESEDVALCRELREELRLDVEVVGRVRGPDAGDWPLDEGTVLRVLRARPADDGDPVAGVARDDCRWLAPGEHDAIRWLEPDRDAALAALAALGTLVTYPSGSVVAHAVVTRAEPYEDLVAVITDRTPFHPVDHGWPDQPADTGTADAAEVIDVRLGAVDDDGALRVGADVDVRRGDPARSWVVVHLLRSAPEVGAAIRLAVDADRRAALSAGHTACHLAALAMNEAAAPYWLKDAVRRDSRGNPDLDQLTVQASRIEAGGSYDRYRFGRSARKAGLDVAGLLGALDETCAIAQLYLDGWVETGATVRVDDGGDATLAARRTWVCELPGPPARMPCGGTHVADLTELGRVLLAWSPTEAEPGLEVRTHLSAPPGR